jgi:hypothetical protein
VGLKMVDHALRRVVPLAVGILATGVVALIIVAGIFRRRPIAAQLRVNPPSG